MTETAWLIEQDSPARGPVWFSAIGPEWRFVSDANEALRFARKKDAETFIKWLGGNPLLSNPRATEHAWMAADGALGRQDEVVQPIRDEPISSSKGEALPVVWKCDGCDRVTDDPDADLAALKAAGKISCCPERRMKPLPRPASDKGEEAVAVARLKWDVPMLQGLIRETAAEIDYDDDAFDAHQLQQLADELPNLLAACPSPGVSREEVAEAAYMASPFVETQPGLHDRSRVVPWSEMKTDWPEEALKSYRAVDAFLSLLSRGEG